jgi:mannose-6-phosphate isomerase class I
LLVGAEDEPRVLVCVDGGGEIEGDDAVAMERGAVVLLPACVGQRPFRPRRAVTLLEVAIGHTS